jgi:hypothetical protein
VRGGGLALVVGLVGLVGVAEGGIISSSVMQMCERRENGESVDTDCEEKMVRHNATQQKTQQHTHQHLHRHRQHAPVPCLRSPFLCPVAVCAQLCRVGVGLAR